MYLTLEFEGDPEHRNLEDQEEIAIEVTTVSEETSTSMATTTTKLETIVCSCGITRCGAIGVFGLPWPTFRAEIEPIPSQWLRDERARAIRSAS